MNHIRMREFYTHFTLRPNIASTCHFSYKGRRNKTGKSRGGGLGVDNNRGEKRKSGAIRCLLSGRKGLESLKMPGKEENLIMSIAWGFPL